MSSAVEPVGQGEPMTCDALLGGAVTLWQPARGRGYRFNLDPVLLAGFAPPATHALDLGAGCGVLGLCLLALGKIRRLTAVELQADLAAAAARNLEANGVGAVARLVHGDLRSVELPVVDLVVFNPPYFPAGHGAAPPEPGRHAARHEVHGTLADFVARASDCLAAEGSLAAIVPESRAAELLRLCAARGLAPVRRRQVVPRPGAAAGHTLVCARRGANTCVEEAPLVVHGPSGRAYSAEVQRLLDRPLSPC